MIIHTKAVTVLDHQPYGYIASVTFQMLHSSRYIIYKIEFHQLSNSTGEI